jgi:hypothetical protein
MLDTLISSKTRIKLLVRLFLNPGNSAHLRGLADEFEESTNAVRLELNRFEEAGMVVAETSGNKKLYKANSAHPLYKDINSILRKYIGLDRIVETIIGQIGNLSQVYLTGDYAQGRDSGVVDLIFVGDINKSYLVLLVGKAESLIGKKIRYLTYENSEWSSLMEKELTSGKTIALWEQT